MKSGLRRTIARILVVVMLLHVLTTTVTMANEWQPVLRLDARAQAQREIALG